MIGVEGEGRGVTSIVQTLLCSIVWCTMCAICAICAVLLGKVLSEKGFLSKEILRCGREGEGGDVHTPYCIRVQ